ncbi:MAG TPA: metal ABC transporter ATP-binding protein [Patescibacteria group bacterium]|nr:metal ABC transporter ATP-binding protein [Patescibacteria group bacterium]
MIPDHSKNIVEVKDLSFFYENNLVLKNINLNIHKGDYIGIIGPNGGGKTTLIKLILNLLEVKTGYIHVDCKNVSYVGQHASSIDQKFPITVSEVVSLGTDKDSALNSMDEVGIKELKNRMIGELSGGQLQKVFIARALAQKPEILFLDEPTSGIDQASQKEFYKLLKKLNQEMGITLVIISHDVDIISKEATEIAAINQSLVFYGKASEFIKEEHGIKFIHHD